MAMTQQSLDWHDLTQVKKGDIGESIVNAYLIGKGFIPYSPCAEGAHPFDRLVTSRDKKTIFIAEIKTKAKRKFYPDTGINISHYREYKHIQDKYGIDIFIFFVDEESKKVYGNTLKILDTKRTIECRGKILEYPLEQCGIRYFFIDNTEHIADIPESESVILQSLTTKKSYYKTGG